MGTIKEVMTACNANPEFDQTFEKACVSTEKAPTVVPSCSMPATIEVAERFQLHCIRDGRFLSPEQVKTEVGMENTESGIKMYDCPMPEAGSAKGRMVSSGSEVRYELHRILDVGHGEHVLQDQRNLDPKEVYLCFPPLLNSSIGLYPILFYGLLSL